ncbi:asparaginase [Cognatishimia sp. MH4019]|uniref:asparaginase n=1 Tax=Cognatishimia sp. MH4019 TaxID=2854030 RepID=UPI001CD1C012|nr:asparaginase [Cognatishimia sp. MH4019]
MGQAVDLVEIWRGDILEGMHQGHAVIVDDTGQIIAAWGDPDAVILPRSSCKMVQALPLIRSGAADAFGLTSSQLALACASHSGEAQHVAPVQAWLKALELGDDDLRCGSHLPMGEAPKHAMIAAHESPCQCHNNCSGKHAGFLTLNKHLGGDAEYIDPAHPVQIGCRDAMEETSGVTPAGYGIDGCSAPNYATTVSGLARAMAHFATASGGSAEYRLTQAMMTHPELVAGTGRACTDLMRAANGAAALKTGAEGVYTGILPGKRLGIALKIADGATRASECVIAALLVKCGVLKTDNPQIAKRLHPQNTNWRGVQTDTLRPVAELMN